MGELPTVSEAVRTFDVHMNLLHRMILRGRLDARRTERGFWLITRSSLNRWAATRKRRMPRTAENSNLQVDVDTNSRSNMR
jgi:hypothetical protein